MSCEQEGCQEVSFLFSAGKDAPDRKILSRHWLPNSQEESSPLDRSPLVTKKKMMKRAVSPKV